MENRTNTEIDEKQSAAIYGGRADEAREPGGAAEAGAAHGQAGAAHGQAGTEAEEKAAGEPVSAEDKAAGAEGAEDDEPGMWQPVRGFLEGRRPSVWD